LTPRRAARYPFQELKSDFHSGGDMDRRRLRDLGCPVKDVVLWTSLDWREALAVAEAAGVALEFPAGLGRDDAHAAVCALHHGVHVSAELGDRLDALLESLHEEAAAAVAARPAEEVAGWLRGDLARLPWTPAALAWAVARDPRPAMRPVEAWLVWRLQVEGLRALAFGKVEIIEVA
jgi:hypothetical protein